MMGGTVLPVTAESMVTGDVNGDGRTNALDALVALRVLSGLDYTGNVNARGFYVTGDTTADSADVALLLRYCSPAYDVALTPLAEDEVAVYQPLDKVLFLESDALRIVSQNIYHAGGSERLVDGVQIESRANRAVWMNTLMDLYAPDVIGLQEYRNEEWFTAFEETIFPESEYGRYIVSRADSSRDTVKESKALYILHGFQLKTEDAYQPDERLVIFWDLDRVELCTDSSGNEIKGMFWISETPDVNSPTFGMSTDDIYQAYEEDEEGNITYENYMVDNTGRIAIWVKLRDKQTDKEFYYFNVHGPNADDTVEAAEEVLVPTVQLLNTRIQHNFTNYGEAPVILGGDFNMNSALESDRVAFDEIAKNFTEVGTYLGEMQGTFPKWGNNVDTAGNVTARVDFFLNYHDSYISGQYQVMEETFDANGNILENFGGYNADYKNNDIADDKYNGYWASDHLGICMDVLWK